MIKIKNLNSAQGGPMNGPVPG